MRGRLTSLDGLRGVAAVAVVIFHMTDGQLPAHGYLAVDLFFMLSGFVLAGAFEDRLRAGLTFLSFMRERLARLYPLYAAGLAIGLAGALRSTPAGHVLPEWAENMCFGAAGGFGLDAPLWSLVMEVAVGALFAGGLWRFGNRALAALVVGAGIALVLVDHHGLTPSLGWIRVFFAFPLGWLTWRLRARLAPLVGRRAPILALLGVCGSWAAPAGVAIDLAAVLVLYPLAVAALALGMQPTGLLAKASSLLGGLSYPLYATHAVVIPLVWLVLPGLPAGLAAALLVAWVLHRTVEPVGRRLILAPKAA